MQRKSKSVPSMGFEAWPLRKGMTRHNQWLKCDAQSEVRRVVGFLPRVTSAVASGLVQGGGQEVRYLRRLDVWVNLRSLI